jgi:hypothetical protein
MPLARSIIIADVAAPATAPAAERTYMRRMFGGPGNVTVQDPYQVLVLKSIAIMSGRRETVRAVFLLMQ